MKCPALLITGIMLSFALPATAAPRENPCMDVRGYIMDNMNNNPGAKEHGITFVDVARVTTLSFDSPDEQNDSPFSCHVSLKEGGGEWFAGTFRQRRNSFGRNISSWVPD